MYISVAMQKEEYIYKQREREGGREWEGERQSDHDTNIPVWTNNIVE